MRPIRHVSAVWLLAPANAACVIGPFQRVLLSDQLIWIVLLLSCRDRYVSRPELEVLDSVAGERLSKVMYCRHTIHERIHDP